MCGRRRSRGGRRWCEDVRVTRVAAIDCGTNSIRLLVADVDPRRRDARGPRPADGGRPARAGRRPDRSDRPRGARAHARRRPALQRHLHGARASRRSGSSRRRRRATRRTGRTSSTACAPRSASSPRSSPGTRRPSCRSAGPRACSARAHPGPFLVVDLGGGSTELVLGTTTPEAAFSMDVGCVRMTERHLRSDPPTADEIAAAHADVARGARHGVGRRPARQDGHARRARRAR